MPLLLLVSAAACEATEYDLPPPKVISPTSQSIAEARIQEIPQQEESEGEYDERERER